MTMIRRCQKLAEAIPHLQAVYRRRSKPLELDGVASIVSAAATTTANSRVFHLFTPSVEKSVWKTVPLNEERQAAVLVTLVCYKNKPALIYTTRSNDLPTHQGEVSFPGGHFDSTQDKTLEETAVREAKEELMGPVSFPWDDITIIGRATPLPSILGTPVTPVIAVLPYEVQSTPDGSGSDSVLHPTIFPGSPDEVANVFCVTIEDLLEIEATEPSDRFKMNIPVFPTHDNKKIWGLTAVVTRPLLHNLFKRVLL